MKFISLKSTAILIAVWTVLYPDISGALVAQNASSALRNDIFVKEARPDRKVIEKRQKEREKRRQEEQKRREKALKEAQKRQELQQKLNVLKENEQIGSSDDAAVFQDEESPKNEIETQLQQQESSTGKTAETSSKDVSYTKSYASKLFQTYSGHITIEQKNIPSKIAVTKGSTLQFNLENKPGTIWYIVNDDKIAKIKSNTESGTGRKVILEATGKGSTKLIFDNILTQDGNYKVLTTKRMRLIVDNAK